MVGARLGGRLTSKGRWFWPLAIVLLVADCVTKRAAEDHLVVGAPQPVVGNGKGYGLRNGRMVHQNLINFTRRDFFPAPVDDLLEATRKKKVPIGSQKSLIAGPEPTISKGALVRR